MKKLITFDFMKKHKNFIEHIIDQDLRNGFDKIFKIQVSPEPNGYLHIGHVSNCFKFRATKEYGAKINLRLMINPEKEEQKYIDAIKENINCLDIIGTRAMRLIILIFFLTGL